MVLGVGNALLTDEGAGIHVLRALEARYDFPPNVILVDGGVLGLSLTGTFMDADRVIVVDAVRGGLEPGTVYRFEWQSKPEHVQYKDTLHQIDLMETMALLPLVGDPPQVVVIGVEFENIHDWGLSLTPKVEAAVGKMVKAVVDELEGMGHGPVLKSRPEEVGHVLGDTSQNY